MRQDKEQGKEHEKPVPAVQPETDSTQGLVNLGVQAREALQKGRLPKHVWAEPRASVLVLTMCAQYAKERARVLGQRQQLRRLHEALRVQAGIRAGFEKVLYSLREELKDLRIQLRQAQHEAEEARKLLHKTRDTQPDTPRGELLIEVPSHDGAAGESVTGG